jgi:iron complex transport system substrate-binding protein
MIHNIIDRKAITKIQTAILVVIITVSCVVGGVVYFKMVNPNAGQPSLTIVDYAGRTVLIKGTITSVASNYPIATEAILLLGGEEKLVGADSSCIGNSVITSLYPNLLSVTDLGYPWSTNLEEIVALAPSVFVVAGSSEETADELEALGIPTVCLSFETPEDFNYALTVIGKLLGKEDEATFAVQYYSDMTELVAGTTQDLADADKPSVMFISYGSQKKYTLKTPGQGMLQNNLIEMSGGTSVSADQAGGWNEISMEQVAAWDPDIIIVTSYASNVSTTDIKNQILSDDTWNVTTAKLEGKVYAFAEDWDAWDSPTPKWILGLCWLGKFIQPDLFASLNLQETANDFYQAFYGITYEEANVTGDM